MDRSAKKMQVYDMVCVALFAVLLALCSWLTIPTLVPFTMQTFGVFLTLAVLGGKRGTLAILVYLLLGAAGIPVFAEFTGGIGILLGNTGGYLLGFLLAGLIVWGSEQLTDSSRTVQIIAMVLGMAAYFAFGTLWFMLIYTRQSGPIGLGAVLGWCVIPFIVPDLIKLGLALSLSDRLRRIMTKRT